MRLAIFGATGTSGSELLTQALDAEHEVRALVRIPSKLGIQNRQLTVVQGDVRDPSAVRKTVEGCDAVLSTLGATDRHDPDVRQVGTANIISAMHEYGIRRFVVMAGIHVQFPGDPDNLGRKLIGSYLGLHRYLVQDTTAMGAVIQESDLDWTVVRVPRVSRGQGTPPSRTGILALGPWSKVSRANVARLMLHCLTDETTVKQAPMICDRSRFAIQPRVLFPRGRGWQRSHT